MMMPTDPTIAILGAGPAACTLACLLAQRGLHPLVFDDGKRPEMLVGESLIPAVVPVLRRLGIEDEVAAIAVRKPGVSFLHDHAESIHFNFAPIARHLPTYAYNVERKSFDALLKDRAKALGAVFLPARARVQRAPLDSGRDLELDEATLAAAPMLHGRQPDLLVDATGRARLFSRLLDIPADRGSRDDVAIFAHYEDFPMPEPAGQVLISRLDKGWSWRIPLPREVMSFGIVVSKETAAALGDTPEERLENAIHREAIHRIPAGVRPRRISPTATYANYQLVSGQSHGRGWVLAGDAFGFADPMLSSGLFLALESAVQIDKALHATGRTATNGPAVDDALALCDKTMREWYGAWTKLIGKFYDGRIFALHEAGHQMRMKRGNSLQHAVDRKVMAHIACMASGATTREPFANTYLSGLCRFLSIGVPAAAELAIR